MKLVKKTVTTINEVVAVAIPGTERFVLVYSRRASGKGDMEMFVMEAKAYEKATSPDDIKSYDFVPDHFKGKKDSFKASFYVFTKNQFEAMKMSEQYWDTDRDVKPLEFGQEIPEDRIVIGWCHGDYTIFDLNEKPINKLIVETYLQADYDIRAMLENEKNNDSVVFIPERKYRPDSFIYYVPGNGYTLCAGIRLSDEDYNTYINLDYCGQRAFLKENSVISKYKRPERLREDEPDDDY